MKRFILITALMLGTLWVAAALAQTPPQTAVLKPTDVQALKLENLQLKAKLAQQQAQVAQAQFVQAMSELNAEAEKVKKENGWDERTQFDANTVAFIAAPAKPAVAAPVAKKP